MKWTGVATIAEAHGATLISPVETNSSAKPAARHKPISAGAKLDDQVKHAAPGRARELRM